MAKLIFPNFPSPAEDTSGPARAFLFGEHRVVPDRRALFVGGHEVAIRSRAFDLLLVLIERRDRVVPKDELMELVWPGRVVEEGNLTVHIAGLRKLLGSGIIATVPGRGYRFVAPLDATPMEAAPTPEPAARTQVTPPDASTTAFLPDALPRSLTRLIGRAADIEQVNALLGASRLVTVVGAGGIGKTRLAIAAADRAYGRFPDGVWLAELGLHDDEASVPRVIASVLGVEVGEGDILQGIIRFLARRRCLLVLDGCEHLASTAAAAAEMMLRACSNLVILATSREPLRAESETLHRLQPLGMAPLGASVAAGHLDDYPASELFVERARAILGAFAPTDAQAREITEICRRLDGIPLAIELAAPTLQALTLTDLRERLDRRFVLLTAGRRTALPRQQTLRATIGWSIDLLTEAERDLLLRLAVFTGGWTVESATAVAGRAAGEDETCRLIATLVDKSLVDADLTQSQPRYRMLGSTRFFAFDRLAPQERKETQAALVQWLATTYRQAEADWPFMADDQWSELYAPEIENLRAGLAWAFGPNGDVALGVELVSYTEHVWTELSLAAELQRWFGLAIAGIDAAIAADIAGRLWLGRCGWMALGDPEALAASREAVTSFRSASSPLDLGRALWRHALQHMIAGAFDAAEPFLQEAEPLLRGARANKALVSWLRARAYAHSSQGLLDVAQRSLDEALSLARALRSRRDIALTLGSIAELHLAAGHPDNAITAAQAALDSLGGMRDHSAWAQPIGGAIASYLLIKGDAAGARSIAAERLEAARMMGLQHEILANLERLALIAALQGDHGVAGRLLGYCLSWHTQRSIAAHAVHDRLRTVLDEQMLPDDLAQMIAEGRSLSKDEILREVAKITS